MGWYECGVLSRVRALLSNHLNHRLLEDARKLLDRTPSPGPHLHTIMINGYVANNQLADALNLFDKMPVRDLVSWNSMLKGCLQCGDLGATRKLFDEMPDRDAVSFTTMVSGYLKFGRVEEAEHVFWSMPERDVVAWNAMVHGYLQNGRVEDGVKLFQAMPCKDVISWTSVISGLHSNGCSEDGLSLFRQMVASSVRPTPTTFASVLTACASVRSSLLGVQVHASAVRRGCCFDEFVVASLITFYANCKEVENACRVFEGAGSRNVVVWTALLTGYSVNCMHTDALRVFGRMLRESLLPNQSTITSALNSCSALEAIDHGSAVHATVVKLGFETDAFVGNSLIVMYMDCGNANRAVAAFKAIRQKNVVSWNTMIVGSSQHGSGKWALVLFNQMLRDGFDPDDITFTGLLNACSHSGMLEKGRRFFEYIIRYKSSAMKIQHFACMVDILGRSGKLDEAERLIRSMPMKANHAVWLALLGACRVHLNFELAERAAAEIFELEPQCSAAYVLLSNLYVSAKRWTDVSSLRVQMKRRGITKQRGSSWVVLRGRRHEFYSGDRSHPLSNRIYEKLDWLRVKMKELGYTLDAISALHDVEDEQKEEMLSYHSERLAIAFALLTTPERSTIVVMKNLRVCGDCHSAIKLMSSIVIREIVVRDSGRFHHFKNGSCSCGDYW